MRWAGQIFPDAPDWEWLRGRFDRAALLHVDISFGEVVARCRGQLAYLATPYSKEVIVADNWCPLASAELAERAACWMKRFAVKGVSAPSPIVLACAALQVDTLLELDPMDAGFWTSFNNSLLGKSDCVIVPAMWGWEESRGIWREVCSALDANKPVYLVRLGSEFAGEAL